MGKTQRQAKTKSEFGTASASSSSAEVSPKTSRKRSRRSSSSKSKKSHKRSKHEKTKTRRKNWSADLDKRFKIMKSAVEDVIENKMTIRNAAEKWDVKRSTLADRVSGKVGIGRRSGPPSILTRAEEQMLAEWIISMAHRGYGVNKKKLLKTVKKILDKDKRKTILKKHRNMPGNKWYRQFVKRNPQVGMVSCSQGRLKMDLTSENLPQPTAGVNIEALKTLEAMVSDTDTDSEYESDSEAESEESEESEAESVSQSLNQNGFGTEVEVVPESEVYQELDDETLLELTVEPVISVGNTVTITTSE
ncbi:uncharacterized protein LOC117289357 [Asterias rubens]|uniref:uncharacterized protein LOC117289357 n=1 Tax=Asterias rubens TaxID=7604 RepID=UPI001455C7A9|nr:uncharacterized protein LOC117289357 [Asterias rubens]